MKKIVSVLISIVLMLTMISGLQLTAQGAVRSGANGDLSWEYDTETKVFTMKNGGNGRGKGYTKNNSTYSRTYNTYASQATEIIVESGIIELGSYTFYNFSQVTKVTLPDTLDTIGDCCFRSCSKLTGIKLPANCYWLYKEAFLDCTSLEWAVLPNGNKTNNYPEKIPDGTFKNCTNLKQVSVGPEFTGVDVNAFSGCSKLDYICWQGDNISSQSTSFTSVPSTCKMISNSANVQSWCNSNAPTYTTISGAVGFNNTLKYSFDPSTRTLSFSGYGETTATPWVNNYDKLINILKFSDVNNSLIVSDNAFSTCNNVAEIHMYGNNVGGSSIIGNSAFENMPYSTYWLDIPANVTSIGARAFAGTNFNYNKIYSTTISVGDDAFGSTGYARFFSVRDSGFYDFVKSHQAKGYNWYNYCINDEHNLQTTVVPPTCTAQGYDLCSCPYCDLEDAKLNFTEPTGHTYSKPSNSGENGIFQYSCPTCGSVGLEVTAIELLSRFDVAISHDNDNTPYNQSNYDASQDVKSDGFVNAKDFVLLRESRNGINLTNKKTNIDLNTTYQTIEGFGASGAWWAQDIGRWNDEDLERVIELIWGETGAGLDIYRYNLGGGSDQDTKISDWRRRAEDFLGPNSDINDATTYDWNADAAARNSLAMAKKVNPKLQVVLFSNSAPASITMNGKAYCSNSGGMNLAEANYQAFATYVANCAEHFIDEGYNVVDVSPINEPEWGWNCDASGNMGQEGSHWEATAARKFFNDYMVPTLQSRAKLNGKVRLSVWESAQLNHSNYWNGFINNMFSTSSFYANNNANIRAYTDSIVTHSYWETTADRNTVANQIKGNNYKNSVKNMRFTEYCQMTNDGGNANNVMGHIEAEGGNTNGMTIDYGLALADTIHEDLTILNGVEWSWWTACSGGVYPDGLVYVDYNNPNNIQTSKRLWCMGNFARFIEEGAVRVNVTTESAFGSNLVTNKTYYHSGSKTTDKNNYLEQSAYRNPDGSVVVVYINNSDTKEYTYFGNEYNSFETYVTDENRNLEKLQAGVNDGKAVLIPAKSVTTVVLK